MYLFTRLDSLCTVLCITAFLLIAVLIALIVSYGVSKMDCDDDFAGKCLQGFKKTLLPAVVFALLAVAVPTQKEAAAIYLIPKLVNNEQVQDIAGKSLDILTLKLNEWVADLTPSEKAK
jgi:hypothetical protein